MLRKMQTLPHPKPKTLTTIVATPFGPFKITAAPQGLIAACFVSKNSQLQMPNLKKEHTYITLQEGVKPSINYGKNAKKAYIIASVLAEAAGQLQAYFAGSLEIFSLPLAPKGTAFQQRVWAILKQIPYGCTTSYAAQSKTLGNPKAIRAVAAANAQNPLAVFIPCHRVVGSNGALTGYAWGLHIKKGLLNLEHPPAQLALF